MAAVTAVLGQRRPACGDARRPHLVSGCADTRQRDNLRVRGAARQRLCAKLALRDRLGLTQCRGHLGDQVSGRALGSDVMFHTTGHILTDHHVITKCTASSRARG
jgi:hypothetical protein